MAAACGLGSARRSSRTKSHSTSCPHTVSVRCGGTSANVPPHLRHRSRSKLGPASHRLQHGTDPSDARQGRCIDARPAGHTRRQRRHGHAWPRILVCTSHDRSTHSHQQRSTLAGPAQGTGVNVGTRHEDHKPDARCWRRHDICSGQRQQHSRCGRAPQYVRSGCDTRTQRLGRRQIRQLVRGSQHVKQIRQRVSTHVPHSGGHRPGEQGWRVCLVLGETGRRSLTTVHTDTTSSG
jgi:hypothetical protein